MSLLGIDVGTTGSKVVIFSRNGEIISEQYKEHSLIAPKQGWVELDPDLIFFNIKNIIKKAVQKTKNDKVRALAISCQGEAIIPVGKKNNTLHNAIVTFDNRTQEQYEYWKKSLGKKTVFEITGMPLNPMYSINKIMWLRKYRKDLFKNTAAFLCFEDFIQMKLGVSPKMSYSLAARTSAFDIVRKEWSKVILAEANIDIGMLSIPSASAKPIGMISSEIANETGLDRDVVVSTGGHDQACGAFGAGIVREGYAMNAIGTSDAITIVLDRPYLNDTMLENNYACAPYVIPDKYTALSVNLTGGLLLKWYRDVFCYEESVISQRENINIYKIIDENIYDKPVDVFILPHFVGSGTPYLDANSKGMIIGIDIETGKAKLSRAVLESNSYDLRFNLEKIESMGIKISRLIAIGGGAKSSVWLQIKSNVLNKSICTLRNNEAASLGAAMLAGISIGQYKDFKEAAECAVKNRGEFLPDTSLLKEYEKRYEIYKSIYSTNKYLLHKISKLNS
ncbi:MAG: FGGY-family carbohydrate kinase [Candidatus Humimicrobiaceae bacterium]